MGYFDAASEKKQRTEKAKNYGVVALFVSPFFLNFISFFLVPVIMGFLISFQKYNPYNIENNTFVGLQNYINVFTSPIIRKTFWSGFATTIKFDLVAIPLMIIIPLGLAYLVNLQPPGYKIFRALIYLPTVVSISIVGIIFGALFDGTSSGFINSLFGTEIKFMDGLWRWVVILIASIWWQTGTNFVIFQAALKNVPKSLYEACDIDGGGRWQAFVNVTIPNIKGSLELTVFNTLIGYLSLYGQPVVLNSFLNRNDIDSPMIFIQKWLNDFSKANLTGLVTASAIIFGLVVMAFSLVEKALMRDRKGGHCHHERRFNLYVGRLGQEETK